MSSRSFRPFPDRTGFRCSLSSYILSTRVCFGDTFVVANAVESLVLSTSEQFGSKEPAPILSDPGNVTVSLLCCVLPEDVGGTVAGSTEVPWLSAPASVDMFYVRQNRYLLLAQFFNRNPCSFASKSSILKLRYHDILAVWGVRCTVHTHCRLNWSKLNDSKLHVLAEKSD